MKIALASDHGGYNLKEPLKAHLLEKGYEVIDLGTDNPDTSVDYPDFGELCARVVVTGAPDPKNPEKMLKADCGIVCCGTGIGISIAANKVKGVRCGVCTNAYMGELTKRHNNANLIAMGGRVVDPETAIEIADAWLTAEYEGGRHQRRLDKIAAIENK